MPPGPYCDAYRGNRFVERNIAERKCGAGGANREHVRIEFRVDRQHRCDQLDVVLVAFGEERTDRTIDLPCAQDAVFRRTSFAFDVPTRNFSGSVHFFFELTGEREEVDALTGLFGGGGGGEDHVLVAVAHEGATVCLLRQLAGLDDEGATPDLERDGFWHVFS